MLIIAQVLREKWLKITGFAHSRTTNKLVNEAANGQDRKKSPAVGTNQIAGFGGFCPLASLKKKKFYPLDNFTNPLFTYLLYFILLVIILFVIIFEKPCLRKDNKG